MVIAPNPDPTRYRPDDMNILGRILPVAAAAAITLAVLWVLGRGSGVEVRHIEDVPAVPVDSAAARYQHFGSAGCLGAACHGAPAARTLRGDLDENTWRSSGSCWVAADPHTAAYAVLTSTLDDQRAGRIKVSAEHIMERYAKGTRAVDDARCLACHTTPALAKGGHTDDPRLLALRAEGVSCEACHGTAGGWVRPHTTAAWSADRDKSYPETGMTRLYDLGERALNCAGCHIGAPAEGEPGNERVPVRDMNHDMIAAGHPRLNFDFAEYQRRLPKHWLEKDRTAKKARPTDPDPRKPQEELKAWLVGRVAHAEAACRLLASRADRAQKDDPLTPWPEYAEFNCAACHHNLRAPAPGKEKDRGSQWRGDAAVLGTRTPGAPAWQAVWPVVPAVGLSPQRPTGLFAGASAKPQADIDAVLAAMQRGRPAGPKAAAGPAAQAAGSLAALRAELARRPEAEFVGEAEKAFARLVPGAEDWDSGLQLLFGLAAAQRAKGPDAAREKTFRDAFGAYRGPPETETARWAKMADAIKLLRPTQ